MPPYLNPVADASTSHLSWMGPIPTVTDTTMVSADLDHSGEVPVTGTTGTGPITTYFQSFITLHEFKSPILYSVSYSAVTMMLTTLSFSVHSPFPFGKHLRLLLADHCLSSAIARAEILALSRDQTFTFPECKLI